MTKSKTKRMTAAQYQATIDALGLSQVGAARFLKIGERTRAAMSRGGAIPYAVELLLNLMIARKIKPEDLGHEG
jgi:hypothetical protein